MAEDNYADAQLPTTAPVNPADFSALLETPVYELIERGADSRGYETRDVKPGEQK